MSQWIFFALAWYGAMTAIWDGLHWLGIENHSAGWMLNGNIKAGLLDLGVAAIAYCATWSLLRRSLKEFVADDK